jgi:hypothetical protein
MVCSEELSLELAIAEPPETYSYVSFLVEQELLSLLEHLGSPLILSGFVLLDL